MPLNSKRPKPLTDKEVLAAAREYLNTGGITYSGHFRRRMAERDISMADIFNVIETGTIERRPEWNEDEREYNYFMVGKDIEGDRLTLKVAISTQDEMLTFITGY